jgi:hypothetical protein
MARLFDEHGSQYLQWTDAGPPVSGPPFTLACWGRTDTSSLDQTLMWTGDHEGDFATSFLGSIEMLPESGGHAYVRATTVFGADEGSAVVGNYSTNTWHHVCGVFAATDDRAVYLDGLAPGTDHTLVSGGAATAVAIGRLSGAYPTAYLSGAVAEAAIWNAALTPAEVRSLARGYSPLQIRTQHLVAYWPLGGFSGQDDKDRLGRYPMTAYNGPSWRDHPPLVYPGRPRLGLGLSWAIGGANPPYRTATGRVWHTGAAAGRHDVPGQRAGAAFTPGPLAGQVHG